MEDHRPLIARIPDGLIYDIFGIPAIRIVREIPLRVVVVDEEKDHVFGCLPDQLALPLFKIPKRDAREPYNHELILFD